MLFMSKLRSVGLSILLLCACGSGPENLQTGSGLSPTVSAVTTSTSASIPDGTTTTAALQVELEAICDFDESIPKIFCRARGARSGSDLRWESNIAGWTTGPTYDIELLESYQLVPLVVITLQQCEQSDCQQVQTKIDTSSVLPTSTQSGTADGRNTDSTRAGETELAAVCTVDNVKHYVSCEAEGYGGGSLTWEANAPGFGTGSGVSYSRELEWGLVLDQVSITLKECVGSDCRIAATTLELSLEPRGQCPTSFDGWFDTFLFEDLSRITEVEPPARVIDGLLEQPGIFRLPYGQNEIEIRMPTDATLVYGLKYLLSSNLNGANPDGIRDVQYGLRFETECEGLWFTIEHMYELSPEVTPYFVDVPSQEAATSHRIGPLELLKGDLVGTQIGFPRDGNAFVAFGIFDDFGRIPTAGPEFINAVCYYDFFSPDVAQELRAKTVRRWPVAEKLGAC